MPEKHSEKHPEKYAEVEQKLQSTAPESKKETPILAEQILETIDVIIKGHLNFERKLNEGNQALIFKLDINADINQLPDDQRKVVENYLGESKSLKVLKITNKTLADNEYDWHYKSYSLYQSLPEEEKSKYASIPKPYINKTINIDEKIEKRLNEQNAEIDTNNASIMLMDWIEGEDLLTRIFRQYLADRPGYEHKASDPNADFSSLLFAVSQDFQARGLNFASMDVLEQYKKLFQAITNKGREVLTPKQREQIKNTVTLLHKNGIQHNDLHFRNFIVEDGEDGKVYLIDFGRASAEGRSTGRDIKDDFVLNFLREYKSPEARQQELKKNLQSDTERIRKLDRDFKPMLETVKKLHGTDLINYLQRASTQWRLDVWDLKRTVAVMQTVSETDKAKAELIREFLKSKKSEIQVEAQQVIDLAD